MRFVQCHRPPTSGALGRRTADTPSNAAATTCAPASVVVAATASGDCVVAIGGGGGCGSTVAILFITTLSTTATLFDVGCDCIGANAWSQGWELHVNTLPVGTGQG